jgi:hypothetical protein
VLYRFLVLDKCCELPKAAVTFITPQIRFFFRCDESALGSGGRHLRSSGSSSLECALDVGVAIAVQVVGQSPIGAKFTIAGCALETSHMQRALKVSSELSI